MATKNKINQNHQNHFWTFALTLDVQDSFHTDIVQSFLSELSADAEHLIGVRRHHSDAAVVQLAPGHGPFFAQLLHSLHDLKNLRWRRKVKREAEKKSHRSKKTSLQESRRQLAHNSNIIHRKKTCKYSSHLKLFFIKHRCWVSVLFTS